MNKLLTLPSPPLPHSPSQTRRSFCAISHFVPRSIFLELMKNLFESVRKGPQTPPTLEQLMSSLISLLCTQWPLDHVIKLSPV